jgi:hypothetical protein
MRHALDCSTGAGLPDCDCGVEPFIAYKAAPYCERTGETSLDDDGRVVRWQRAVKWIRLGTAADMAQAKAKFGGYPVLEQTKERP